MIDLYHLRTENHLRQQAVADAAGISLSHYSFIEAGKRYPSPEVAQRLADALGIPERWTELLKPTRAKPRLSLTATEDHV